MRKVLLLAAVTVLLAAPVLAESVQTFVGNTAGGPTFNRPGLGDPPSTLSGLHTRYSAQSFKLMRASHCYVVSAQTYDGWILLYRNSFSPASPLTNLLSSDDDGILSVGTSYIPSSGSPGEHTLSLAAGTYVLVTTAISEGLSGPFQNTIHCDPNTGSTADPILVQGSCGAYLDVPDANTICLGDHFLVAVYDVTHSTQGGFGVPVRIGSNDTGLFWFYNDTNWELMLKVLNACGLNGHYWVFGGALTNQGYNIVIHDWQSGGQNHYINHEGTRAPAIADTAAFDCP